VSILILSRSRPVTLFQYMNSSEVVDEAIIESEPESRRMQEQQHNRRETFNKPCSAPAVTRPWNHVSIHGTNRKHSLDAPTHYHKPAKKTRLESGHCEMRIRGFACECVKDCCDITEDCMMCFSSLRQNQCIVRSDSGWRHVKCPGAVAFLEMG
jgi:hypothetical protein